MDIRYALRGFSRRPGLAAIAIGFLASVIALNTAIFSIVDAVFLKPLPVRHSDELTTTNGEERDFSELIFDQLRLRIGQISTLPFAGSDAAARIEMADPKLRPQTQRVRVSLISGEYSRVRRAKEITSRERRVEDDQADEVEIAGLNDECPLSRDKVVISKRVDLKQNLLVIITLTPGEVFREAVKSPDKVQKRSVRTTDCSVEGTSDPCVLPHEDRSTTHAAARNQNCVPLIFKKVEVENEDQGPDNGQTPAPPPDRAQDRRR